MAASDMATNDIASGWDFMFTWTIENWPVSFLPSFAKSPPFHTERLLDTKWHLEIRSVEERKLLYSIHRDKRVNHSWYPVDAIFEISFLDPDGSTVVSRKQTKCFDSILYHEFIYWKMRLNRKGLDS
ncbi:uncharacterized protein TNCV_2904531 [Trichonephila clavipes]|nr:uncharacterized protein TNCV_2904531 [Trichonephila clavipes]